MLAKSKISKNDLVIIITGKDKGKKGRVLLVKPREGKVLVEGVAVVQKHMKSNPRRGTAAGIIERESMISVSNVQLICPTCSKPTRVAIKVFDDNVKRRQCKKCSASIERE